MEGAVGAHGGAGWGPAPPCRFLNTQGRTGDSARARRPLHGDYGPFHTRHTGKPPAEAAKEVCELLLRRGLLRRCDHLYKKPPPGRKLAKYPRKLVFFQGPEAQVGLT